LPALADFCLIYVLNGDRFRCAASAHVTSAGDRLLRAFNRVYRIGRDDRDSTVAQVVRSGRPSLRADIRPERGAAPTRLSARVAEVHRRLNVRSSLVVPIKGRTGVLGAIALGYGDSRRRYTPSDIPVAQRLARQAAIALEHAPILDELLRHERLLHRTLTIRLRARA
jgi:GAF domain-containing protein